MIDITRFNVKFNNKKDIIIKTFIDYYGIQYAEVIKERISNLIIDFSSMPDAEYEFSLFYSNLINDRSIRIIESRYKKYSYARKTLKRKYLRALLHFIRQTLKCENLDGTALQIFTSDEFGESLIDAFKINSLALIGKNEIPEQIRNTIVQDIRILKQVLSDYNVNDISIEQSESIIEFRNWVALQYKRDLIYETGVCNALIKKLPSECLDSYPRTLNSISDIVFVNNPTTGRLKLYKDENVYKTYPYIKMPILLCLSKNLKGTDGDLIHELIHVIETCGDITGIFKHDDHNSQIVNEIRTEILAQKLTHKLHENGVFVFDNPKDYAIGRSAYALYFPYVKDFFCKYEDIFSKCAINTNPDELHNYFGDAWDTFCEELTNSFDVFLYYYGKEQEKEAFEVNKERIEELINTMEEYSHQQKTLKIV